MMHVRLVSCLLQCFVTLLFQLSPVSFPASQALLQSLPSHRGRETGDNRETGDTFSKFSKHWLQLLLHPPLGRKYHIPYMELN